jgi:hypothetical protein
METLNGKDRQKILSLYGLYDGVVPWPASHIPGATNRRVPTIGHAFTIAAMITIGPAYFTRFLKRR